jgi:hypothetical protein
VGSGSEEAHLDTTETVVVAALVSGLALLRSIDALRFRVDSDEAQHLHVVWGWTHGLLQYRDVFDNHAPLFHLLYAPVLLLVGERANVVPTMRLTVLPLYLLALAGTYGIAEALFSRRIALWATLLTAFYGTFFFTSLEFRADDLWAALWLLGLACLVRGEATPWRRGAAGLLLGAALGTSLKTTLLLASVGIAALAVRRADWRDTPARGQPRPLACGAAFLAGLVLVPAALLAYFAFRGGLAAMYDDTIAHNVLPGLGLWHSASLRILMVPAATPLLWLGARRIGRAAPTAALARRRVFVSLTLGVAATLLFGVWPLVTRQDYLVLDPLIILLATGFVLTHPPAPLRRLRASTVPLALIGIESLVLVTCAPPWRDGTRDYTSMVAAVLRLTAPDDYVMDVKGEAVFRPRPYYYAIEHITKARLKRGLIADDVAERLVATGTTVAMLDQANFPPDGRAFLNANYLPVGPVRVLGRFLAPASAPVRFDVAIPTRYAIVAEDGRPDGMLDGLPYDGPRFLRRGAHEFEPTGRASRLALVWEPALEHGFSPFPLARKESHAASG